MDSKGSSEEGEKKGARERVSEGLRQGIGVLSAFKDALDETIQEARDRGDLSTERAKEVMKDALGRAQAAASEAKERLEFARQGDLEALQTAVAQLKDRVAALELQVFGEPDGAGSSEASTENGGGDKS